MLKKIQCPIVFNEKQGTVLRNAAAGVLSILLLFFVPPVRAQIGTGTIRVAPSGSDTADCGAVSTPCQTLQHAVDLIPAGDSGIILVAAGTYIYTGSGTSQTGREVVRIVSRRITIRGGYNLTFTTADPGTNLTTFDGENLRRVITTEPDSSNSTALTLSGVTLTRGNALPDAGTSSSFGGALDAIDSSVTLINVRVISNVARGLDRSSGEPGDGAGGGLSFRSAVAVSLYQVTLEGNLARGGDGTGNVTRGGLGVGGGLFAIDTPITIDGLMANNNTARGGDAPNSPGVDSGGVQRADGLGGGLNFVRCSISTQNLTIVNNIAQGGMGRDKGGLGMAGGIGIELGTGTSTIQSALIRNNQALGAVALTGEGGAGLGGGINADSPVNLQAVTIIENLAQGAAGGAQGGDGGGGGLYENSSTVSSGVDATNLIVGSNIASAGTGPTAGLALGGGVFFQLPFAGSNAGAFKHVTLVANEVRDGRVNQGAAVFVNGISGAKASLVSEFAIVANHTSVQAVRANGDVTFNNTLWDGNTQKSQTGTVGSFLDNLSFTGSPEFMAPLATPPDYHIRKTSAAIDRAVSSTIRLDIDGQIRPYPAIPNTGVRDLGADEYYSPIYLTPKIANSSTLRLNWTTIDDPNVAGYQITYILASGANQPAEGTSPIDVSGGPDTDTADLTNLSTRKPYTLSVHAVDSDEIILESSNLVVISPADLVPIYLPMILKNFFH